MANGHWILENQQWIWKIKIGETDIGQQKNIGQWKTGITDITAQWKTNIGPWEKLTLKN